MSVQTLTLAAIGFTSQQFQLLPGQSVDLSLATTDLDLAEATLWESDNGVIWRTALDETGTVVGTLDGDGTTQAVTAVLRNETPSPKRYSVFIVEDSAASLVGTVTATFTTRGDKVALTDVIHATDEGVTIDVPMTDSEGNAVVAPSTLEVEAGVGITGTAAGYATSVVREGALIRTTIYVDIAGLNGGGTAGDVIGADGAGVAHLGQITDAVNGAIVAGTMHCAEAPTTSDPDVDLWSANEATGVEDTAITALTGEAQLTDGGDHTLARTIALTAFPVSGQYLYLVGGDATAGTYDAGKFVIELLGLAE